MTALAALLVETTRRCIEVLGDEELCRRVITIATEAVANGRVYIHGRSARVVAWSANYEQIHFAASGSGVVLELTARGLPLIVIYITTHRTQTCS